MESAWFHVLSIFGVNFVPFSSLLPHFHWSTVSHVRLGRRRNHPMFRFCVCVHRRFFNSLRDRRTTPRTPTDSVSTFERLRRNHQPRKVWIWCERNHIVGTHRKRKWDKAASKTRWCLEGKLLAEGVVREKNRFPLSSRSWDNDCLFEGF